MLLVLVFWERGNKIYMSMFSTPFLGFIYILPCCLPQIGSFSSLCLQMLGRRPFMFLKNLSFMLSHPGGICATGRMEWKGLLCFADYASSTCSCLVECRAGLQPWARASLKDCREEIVVCSSRLGGRASVYPDWLKGEAPKVYRLCNILLNVTLDRRAKNGDAPAFLQLVVLQFMDSAAPFCRTQNIYFKKINIWLFQSKTLEVIKGSRIIAWFLCLSHSVIQLLPFFSNYCYPFS